MMLNGHHHRRPLEYQWLFINLSIFKFIRALNSFHAFPFGYLVKNFSFMFLDIDLFGEKYAFNRKKKFVLRCYPKQNVEVLSLT